VSYELIIFDWDGTLMDSTRLIASCLQNACRDLGLAVPEFTDARYVIGLGLADTVRYVAPSLNEEGAGRLVERYRHHFLAREHEATPYTGVIEMLRDLHGRGKRLAVATGKARRGLERALDATGLRPWFEATRCADEGSRQSSCCRTCRGRKQSQADEPHPVVSQFERTRRVVRHRPNRL